MPELPEVETVRTALATHIEGRQIMRAKLHRADLRFPFPAQFTHILRGSRIMHIDRRAKYLLITLQKPDSDPYIWVTHLGMTGRFSIDALSKPPSYIKRAETHEHVTLLLDDNKIVRFSDPRRFGYMDLLPATDIEQHKYFRHVGVEPLGDRLTRAYLADCLAGKTTLIKSALLDQRLIAGLGNIYVCEALFMTGISPRRQAGTLDKTEIAALRVAIRKVLRAAIRAGGSTLRDFRSGDGARGYFQHNFKVYGREGKLCANKTCDGVIERIVQAGRSSFYCPQCQK